MGFWQRIFKKKTEKNETSDQWADIVYSHDNVDFSNEEQRSRYITNCMEQLADASKEIDLLTGEYSLVTAYLTEIEEIEALPEGEREKINQLAHRLDMIEDERNKYLDRSNRMKESSYYKMKNQEDEIEEGIAKLSEAEKYGACIKQDMQRLAGEKDAYEFRKDELIKARINYKGMAIIFLTAFAFCMVMLLILQFVFEMNTYAGYFIAALSTSIAISVLAIKYMDANKEGESVERSINRLIQLQNTVKIRYVNNTNLLDYLYMKYDVDSSKKLKKRWEKYLEEKELRRQYIEVEAKADRYKEQLKDLLSNYRVKDAARWVRQPKALLDPREMVEIRHDLILRRQALRKQLDYNQDVAQNAQSEIKVIAAQFPEYADEIMDMVEKYEKQGL